MGGAKVPNPTGVLGSHPNLRRALAAARRVGPTKRSVLIRGESGTGKERLARLVHETSGRRGAFVAINCATLVESLLESELFGHERGAFTGASGQKKGLFEAAHRGTLFLDEIGDLPITLQAGLLRVLQEGKVRRVGGTVDVDVDVRIVAATHRDLLAMSGDGGFRLDLYHRLAEYRVHLPPLRERGRDVVTIARHLLAHEFVGDTPRRLCRDAEDLLVSYPWPGNIRELRNVLSQVALDVAGRRVTAAHLRAALPGGVPTPGAPEDLDRAIVEHVQARGAVAGPELRQAFHLSKSAAQRRLQRLQDAGRLAITGLGRGARYVVPAPVADAPADGFDARKRAALAIARRDGRVTRRTLADGSGLPVRTAGRVLAGLVEAGVLAADEGRGSAAGYVVVAG